MSGTPSTKSITFTPSDNGIDAAKRGLDVYRMVDSKMREAWRDDGQGNSNRLLKTPARANTVPTGPLTEILSILAPGTRLSGTKYIDNTGKVDPFISAADEYFNTIKTRTLSIPEKYGKFYNAVEAAENRNKGPGSTPTEKDINEMENVLIVRAFDLKNRLDNWNPSTSVTPAPVMMSPYMVAPAAYPAVQQNNPDLTSFQSAIRSLQSNTIALKVGAYASSEAEYRRYFSDVLETNKWNINNWQDFLSAVNLLQNDLREVVNKARDKYVREREGRPDPLTRMGATFAVFVGLSSNPTNLPIGMDGNLLLSHEEVAAVQNDGILTIGALQSALMPALEEICAAARSEIKRWLDRPAENQNATYKAQIQDLSNKLDQIIGDIQGSVLPSSPPPQSLQVTIQLLGSLKRELIDKDQARDRDPTELASPDTAIQAVSEGLPPVAGFLFRQISVERVAKYEDTIRKFRDVVDALPLKERVATQKKRLEEACDRFAKEFESASAKGADGITKSAAEVAIMVKKLNDAKVSAVTSFARGVRGNARNYLAVHEAFVTRQHGEGLRYMQYWTDIHTNDPERDPKKKLVNDKRVVDLLVNHSKLRQELEDTVVETMVRSPTAILQEAEKARVLAMTKQPLLDEHHQMIVDKEFDRLREWIVARTEQGQELYMRGSPTLLESITDSTVLGVYTLKAIRLGIAWVSLRVASRTFQAWYSRAVYEQNGIPPNPAFFVALFLGLDAALHAVVLTILYGIMMLYKSQENDFPIDSNLLNAWALDYAMVTVVVGVISVILAMVVRSKKYFRYRYEGERGIRALQEMCMSTYAVILFLPFYRLAYT
jgi:hypothetical protein